MGSAAGDKAAGRWNHLKGSIRSATGRITKNRDQQARGEFEKSKGKTQQAKGDVRGAARKAKDAVTGE